MIDGDDFSDVLRVCMVIFGSTITLFLTIAFCAMIGGWLISGLEYQAWNKLHGTNYTQWDWFTSSGFIKNYHYPDREKALRNEIKLIAD